MKFGDKSNPYFGKYETLEAWAENKVREYEKEMEADDWECEGAPYGVSVHQLHCITLAGGGPCMDLTIETCNGEVLGGKFHYSWWGDPEDAIISQEQAEILARYFGIDLES